MGFVASMGMDLDFVCPEQFPCFAFAVHPRLVRQPLLHILRNSCELEGVIHF